LIDLHSHILPGVDDGAKDIHEAIELIKNSVEDGVATIVATPHFFTGGYMPSKEEIKDKIYKLTDAALSEGVSIKICPGSECYVDYQLVKMVRDGKVMTINDGGKYILVEFPRMELPSSAADIFFQLQMEGITPIIAHPERNIAIAREPNILRHFIEKDILVQVNVGSLTGFYGSEVQKIAKIIITHRMAHIIASDSHRQGMADKRSLTKGYTIVQSLLGDDQAFEAIKEAPKRILEGKGINVPEPVEYRPKRSIWKRIFG
jgi:protein-tyrosine phosphatase